MEAVAGVLASLSKLNLPDGPMNESTFLKQWRSDFNPPGWRTMNAIPAGPCEACQDEAPGWTRMEPQYVDSVPDPSVSGTHPSECGYRPELLCMVHASERRKINTSRVQEVLLCESENAYRIDGGRASGECVCDTCKRPFRRHPAHKDYPFLVQLCDGTLVKL